MIKIPLGTLVTDQFIGGFRKLRTLPLREAYALALCSGVIEPQLTAWLAARNASIKRIGGGDRILETEPAKLAEFRAEMLELGQKEIVLPLDAKIKFPEAATQEPVFTADELGALLATIMDSPT
ncbi:MAG: hypothetical protein A2Y38_07985 [Spirochaetes bacterium GWB1_59_5]|nr:MAG: hypothetical protein A2Y38_07985 [Spirochaetes bacterium GWB1_59_5]